MEGVALANRQLAARGSLAQMKLTIAGGFVTADEKREFDRMLQSPEHAGDVEYLGFVSGAQKEQNFARGGCVLFSDLLLWRKPAGQSDRSHGVRAAHRDDALAFAARNAAAGLSPASWTRNRRSRSPPG